MAYFAEVGSAHAAAFANADLEKMNGVYEKYFSHKPARSCVAVKQLPKGKTHPAFSSDGELMSYRRCACGN